MPSPSVALLRTQSDARLVALAAAGHERAFEAIVERYRRQLLRHARRHLPEARAEDALQQALVSAWTALRRGDDVRELRPWLHRIVRNSALNTLRAPGYDYDELHATLQGSGGPAELAERRAVVRSTLAGLAALPEWQREALLQIAVEGRSQDEVAEQLGLSHGAVRQLVHRARTALRGAATAVVPLPLATWLATAGAGRGDVAVRVGELVAGAGGSATLAKAGAVAVIAGGAVAGPAVVHDASERGQRSQPESAARARTHADGERAREVAAAPVTSVDTGPSDGRSGAPGDRSGPGRGDDSGSHERADDRSGASRGGDRGSGSHGGDEPDRRDGEQRERDDGGSSGLNGGDHLSDGESSRSGPGGGLRSGSPDAEYGDDTDSRSAGSDSGDASPSPYDDDAFSFDDGGGDPDPSPSIAPSAGPLPDGESGPSGG
jgi:RNA polymerase sigma factor (sigma-70 family)